jgi:DNA-binding response OmpR family regulator
VRALLRRAGRGSPRDAGPSFVAGAAEVDLDAFEVRRAGAVHALSPKEAQMLRLLHENLGKAVSRERFLAEVWDGVVVGTRTIDTHVLNLRTKLEVDPQRPRHLLTVHGVGYRLVLGGTA